MSSAYRSTSRSVKECASMEQLISLSQNLSNVAWPNKNFENKISKLVMPSPANLTEFLVGLVEERADDNMADNIYLLSLMFPYLGYKKEKKGEIKLEFKANASKAFEKMPKSFNFNTTLKVLARFGVTAKSQPAIIKTLKIGITETKKELSVVCFAIVLTAIQDRKSFKKIKQNMKHVVKSELLQSTEISESYLAQLRNKLKHHRYRSAFANCVVETLADFNTKQLTKKFPLNRQVALVKMVKRLFYLKTSEIHAFMDKVQNWLGGNLFAISMDLLLDEESLREIAKWFPSFWQISLSSFSNPTKRRIALAYASMLGSDALDSHKLSANQRTVSFFCGVLANPSKFMDKYKLKFDLALLETRYYALGILLRNYQYINEIAVQVSFVNSKQLSLTDEYLTDWLNFLNDSEYSKDGIALGNPLQFMQGLQRLRDQPLFSQTGKRKVLWAVNDFMDQLARIRNEQRSEVRKVLILNLKLRSRFEEVAKKYEEPMVSERDIAMAKMERNVLSEIKSENSHLSISYLDKRKQGNAMPIRAKYEEMELGSGRDQLESNWDQPEGYKRSPFIDLNGRGSSQNSQSNRLFDDD